MIGVQRLARDHRMDGLMPAESHDEDRDLISAVQAGARQHLSLVISDEEAVRAIDRLSKVGDDSTVEVSGRELLTGRPMASRIGRQHFRPPEAPMATLSR